MGFVFFAMLSLQEVGEPNWDEMPSSIVVPQELTFDLDTYVTEEIGRVTLEVERAV